MKRLQFSWVLLSLAISGCNDTTTKPQPPAPSFLYTDSRTGQQITVIDDAHASYLGDDVMTQNLNALPANHLHGLTTLHGSDWMDEVAGSAWFAIAPVERRLWNMYSSGIPTLLDSAPPDFKYGYKHFLTSTSKAYLDEIDLDIQTQVPFGAQVLLFMITPFIDAVNHQVMFYSQQPNGALIPDPLPYKVTFLADTVCILTIGTYSFQISTFQGRAYIVKANGAHTATTLVPENFALAFGIPNVIYPEAITSLMGVPAGAVPAAAPLTPNGQIVSPEAGQRRVYISPNAPNVYVPVNDPRARAALRAEMQTLRDPRALLQSDPGGVPHGFTNQ